MWMLRYISVPVCLSVCLYPAPKSSPSFFTNSHVKLSSVIWALPSVTAFTQNPYPLSLCCSYCQQKRKEGSVLICLSCHNKTSQAGRLKAQKCIYLVLEARSPYHGVSLVSFWWELSSSVPSGSILTVCAHMAFPSSGNKIRGLGWREFSTVSSFKDTNPVGSGPHPYDII